MKIEKLDKLNKYLDSLCENYIFDEVDEKNFNLILERTIRGIGVICDDTKERLVEEFGEQ